MFGYPAKERSRPARRLRVGKRVFWPAVMNGSKQNNIVNDGRMTIGSGEKKKAWETRQEKNVASAVPDSHARKSVTKFQKKINKTGDQSSACRQ